MLKPLELPLRVRFWHFIRGLLFYNTVYWKRASDDLKPQSLSREERLNYQPERNLEFIRPREHPRAKIVAAYGGQVSLPTAGLTPMIEAVEPEAVAVPAPAPVIPVVPVAPLSDAAGQEIFVRRRRYRRRSKQVRPNNVGSDPELPIKPGLFSWLFSRKKDR